MMSYFEHDLAPDPADMLKTLARVNRFSMAELTENRNGRIATTQMFTLMLKAVRPVMYSGGALLGWLLFLAGIKVFVPDIMFVLLPMRLKGIVTFFVVMITLSALFAFAVGLARAGKRTIGLFSDLSGGKVASMEGRVWASRGETEGEGLDKLFKQKVGEYNYVLNGQYFEVSDLPALSALVPREMYRLYYAPKSRLLLSIEPIAPPKFTSSAVGQT